MITLDWSMCPKGRFSKIRSQMSNLVKLQANTVIKAILLYMPPWSYLFNFIVTVHSLALKCLISNQKELTLMLEYLIKCLNKYYIRTWLSLHWLQYTYTLWSICPLNVWTDGIVCALERQQHILAHPGTSECCETTCTGLAI